MKNVKINVYSGLDDLGHILSNLQKSKSVRLNCGYELPYENFLTLPTEEKYDKVKNQIKEINELFNKISPFYIDEKYQSNDNSFKIKYSEDYEHIIINSYIIANEHYNNFSELYDEEYELFQNYSTRDIIILKLLIFIEFYIFNNYKTLIINEAENGFHPQHQLILAEALIKISKYFDINLILSTNSPFFLRAIQVYAAKYELADKCNYYLVKDGNIELKNGKIDEIYGLLSNPLQVLEDLSWSLSDN